MWTCIKVSKSNGNPEAHSTSTLKHQNKQADNERRQCWLCSGLARWSAALWILQQVCRQDGAASGFRCLSAPPPPSPTPRSLLTDGFDEGTCWVGAALGFSLLNSSRRRTERKSMARKFPAAPDDPSTGSPPLSAKLMFFCLFFGPCCFFPSGWDGGGDGGRLRTVSGRLTAAECDGNKPAYCCRLSLRWLKLAGSIFSATAC